MSDNIYIHNLTQDNRTQEEIYANIVSKIKLMYQGNISEAESHEAARNLIGLCQIILDFKCEQQGNLRRKRK